MKFNSLLCVAVLLVMMCFSANAQNHSFTYNSPICSSSINNPSPTPSSNFVFGGNYIGSPGLSVNFSTGVVNVSASTPGVHSVTYTAAFCGCFTNSPVSATIQILAAPSLSISGSSSICAGAVLSLSATAGAASYFWNTGATTPNITDTPLLGVVAYSVTATSAGGCTTMATKNVTVVAQPTASIAGNPSVCVGYNYSMTAVSPGPATYTWTGPGLNSNAASVSTTLASVSVYSLTVSVAGCTASATHTVQVNALPSITIVGPSTLCMGSGVTLMAQGAVNYTWSTGAQADTVFLNPTQSIQVTVFGSDFNNCASSKSHTIIVHPRPNISIQGSNNLCTGTPLILTAIGGVSGTYTWNNGAQTNTVEVFAQQDTTIIVQGSNAQGCIGTSAPLLINVSPSPTISVTSASVCRGTAASLQATSSNTDTGVTFQWFPGNGTGPTFSPAPIATTIYTVVGTLGPCISRMNSTVTVISTSVPAISFSYAANYCSGNPPVKPTLNPKFVNGGTFSSFSSMNLNSTTGEVDLSSLSTGYYTVQYSVAAQGCTLAGSSSSGFFVNKTVEITMVAPILEILPGQTVKLFNSGGANSYQWTPSEGLDCPSCQTPIASPQSTQIYCISSSQPCVIGSCVMVDVLCINNGDLSLPNAFTPNNDGKNDKFCLQGWNDCNEEFNIQVFDRWGGIVYESQNPNFCWDGNFNGNPLPTAVYVYIINAKFKKEAPFRKSGNISLIR